MRLGGAEILKGVDLAVAPGEVVALLGPNGSGKSSLLRALAGMLPHGGRRAVPARLGYMPQDNGATGGALTVLEVALLGRLRHLGAVVAEEDLAIAAAALEEIGIAHLAERPLAALSGGQRQMAFLAQVLAGEPEAMLLDEPTSALDIRHGLHVLQLVRGAARARGLPVLVVLHDLNAAARCADRIAVMQEGRLRGCASPAAMLTPAMVEAVFGVVAEIRPARDGLPAVIPLEAVF
nr:ABC transporter ATP-binding protein [Roseomonas sp. GC11]